MSPKFGTSGLRGLVSDLTDDLVADYVRAFVRACPTGAGIYVARDLRPSSTDILEVVIEAARTEGKSVTDCGAIPTPALALAAMHADAAAIMVTGSHIPADRNGLKFYVPHGEITKRHEQAIIASLGQPARNGAKSALFRDPCVGQAWVNRYVKAFGDQALTNRRIGHWSHSSVGRDFVIDTLRSLGATVIELDRSEQFVAVDTEAVPGWARSKIRSWILEHRLDAVVSTDGDGDRPLVADDTGAVIPGDVLGQITARTVGARYVVTPITSNRGVELSGRFERVVRTKVGSPYVIEAMEQFGDSVIGYEANGGFLLGFDTQLKGPLSGLMTRDSLLPIISVLVAAGEQKVSTLVSAEPPRFTASDRIEDVDAVRSSAMLRSICSDTNSAQGFLSALGEEFGELDTMDGVRIVCRSLRIVHLRPSGNAPEMRIYVEAESLITAERLFESVRREVVVRLK